jgi:hypothetical protein
VVPGAVAALLPAETPAAALRGDAADPVPGEDALLAAGRVAEAGRGAYARAVARLPGRTVPANSNSKGAAHDAAAR